MELLTPSVGVIFWGTIVFVILLVLLAKFAWKPMLTAVNEREKSISDSLELADKTRHEMQQLQAQNENLLKEARAEKDSIIKEANEAGKKLVAEAQENAKAEANRMIEEASRVITSEKNAAMSEIKTHVASLSLEIAETIVKGQLSTDEKQKALANQLAEDISLN
jgi:F-type H+-transporting ATPase subunit b